MRSVDHHQSDEQNIQLYSSFEEEKKSERSLQSSSHTDRPTNIQINRNLAVRASAEMQLSEHSFWAKPFPVDDHKCESAFQVSHRPKRTKIVFKKNHLQPASSVNKLKVNMVDLRRSIEKIYLYQGAPLSGASFEYSPPNKASSTKRKSISSAVAGRRKE